MLKRGLTMLKKSENRSPELVNFYFISLDIWEPGHNISIRFIGKVHLFIVLHHKFFRCGG